MESGNGQEGGAGINATTNPERLLNPRSLLPGQDDDWVTYPLDEFAITTITEVVTDLVGSAGISPDLDPADLIANWGAETDVDPAVADEAAAKESSSLRLKPGVIHRTPRLLLKILRYSPNHWRWEERSLRNRLGRLQHRVAQVGSLSDKDLLTLVSDIIGLFQECLHDGATYYSLGLAWTNQRTNRLLRKRPDASGDLADNILTYYLQLLVERRSRLSSLFRQYQELNEDAQHLHLPERLEEVPEAGLSKTQNPVDLENLILERLRTLSKGRRFESRIDAFLSALPVPLEQLDQSFSLRMKLPPRLLVTTLSSGPVDELDGSSRGTNVAKRVAKKLPLRRHPRWNRLITKTQQILTGLVGTVFLLLEVVPVFHQAFDEVARCVLGHRRMATPEDLVLLKFSEISKSLLGRESQHELVARRRAEHHEKMAEHRAKQANAVEIGEEDGNATPVSLAKLFSPSGQGNPRTGMSQTKATENCPIDVDASPPAGRQSYSAGKQPENTSASRRSDTMGRGNGQLGGTIIDAMTNPNGSLDPRSLLPGQDDDWVMYPLDELAITTVTEVITGLVSSAGIDLDLKPADLMSDLNARTDPNADPMVAKEATADKPLPFRLKPGVFFHAPRLLFKVLRHDPTRQQREERSFRNRIKFFKHRTAQAGSLSDRELTCLAEDVIDLFRTCPHGGAMYYGLGLVWMYWRAARLLGKRSNAGGELTENVTAYFLQLLLTDQKNPPSPLFEQFRKLSADTQRVDLQAFVVSIPDSVFMTASTSRDIEKAIFKKLCALPKGQQIETQVDVLLADLPVAPEAVDWPFSPRPQLPFRLLMALLDSESIEGLDELLTDEDATKQAVKKLPFKKRPPWRRNVAKTRGLMAGAVGTVFLLLEIILALQRALSEVAQRLLRRRQVEIAEGLMLLQFDDILKALVDQADRQDLVLENHHAHIKKLTACRRARQLEAKETKTLREDNNETPVSLGGLTSEP